MNEVRIGTWTEFVAIADHLDIGPANSCAYAFRGQADAAWGLQPTLLRYLLRLRLNEVQSLELEKQALAEFKAQAHHYIQHNLFTTTTDTISWWTLMQHHGAPTRLLDWTASIYIAAYFAVTGSLDKDGAIWIVHTSTMNSCMNDIYGAFELPRNETVIVAEFLKPGAKPCLCFASRLNKSDRMISQQGIFSVCKSIIADHGQVIGAVVPDAPGKALFYKVVIPANCKNVFLRKLRTMNITANSLFPGLDGLARSVGELVQLGEM